ncbi:hypothetical protein GGR52DRAFT_570733 [Hypoxylon sp. FL1284]|nr:hypothetical protein GGR52DRAFT_570733 [Hypoxylon sp. FL1284]
MDGLLDAPRANHVCNSVQDMQSRLQNLLASKSSDTRAEHASFTFELRYNTVFHLSADAENGSPDGAVEPAQPIARSVSASETIQNQPSDDPALQRAVAKHIINAMGIIDSSSWVVRQVSRDNRGWTFTYICKDSLQAWTRANAKGPEKPAIASFSGPGGLDPGNLSRPAFDCRGTLMISFSTSARGVVVKYNHTPIHKTVAQLVELLAPALPPVPARNGNVASQRTPRAKRPPPAESEEGSSRRKRQKKKGEAPEAPMGEVPAGEPSNEGDQGSQDGVAPQNSASDNLHFTSNLSVPPEEAERRRTIAINLLKGRDIDPVTLTTEQFNIFANQAPDLQTASLEMLAKYGAERLRIVHPDEKDQAPSASSTPTNNQPSSSTPTAGPATTSAPGTNETPTRKRRSRKKKSDGPVAEVSIGNGAVVSVEESGEVGTTESALKPTTKRTRGACQTCKQKKKKCTKEHPSCSVCIKAGDECVYPPPKPCRKRSAVNGGAEEQDSDLPEETEENQARDQPQAPVQVSTTSTTPVQDSVHGAFPPPPDPDNDEFIPDPNILSRTVEHQPAMPQSSIPPPAPSAQPSTQPTSDYFNQIHFPRNSSAPAKQMAMPELTCPDSHAESTHSESSPGLTYPVTSQQSNRSARVAFTQQIPPASQTQSASGSGRHSLPSGHTKQTPVPAPSVPQSTTGWNASPVPVQATRVSPSLTKQSTPKRSRNRKSGAESSQQGQRQESDGIRQAAALSQAAVQQQDRPSPVVGSPYQNAALVNSRQGNRSHTTTPVAATSRPPPQAPQSATNASYNATSSAAIPNYDPYARYDNSTSSQYTTTADNQSSSRIAYEPDSYHPTTTASTTSTSYSSAPAYDYSQSNRPSNPLSQALNNSTGFSSTSSATSAQWPPSRPQSTQPHSQSHATNSYSMPPASTSVSHSYGTRSAGPRTQPQNTSYNQPQSQQSYNTYPAQQSSTNQQHQQDWYGFHSANHSNNSSSTNQNSYNANQNSGYSSAANPSRAPSYNMQRSSVPTNYPGQSYGAGSDDQSLYDLLRTGSSTH